MRHAVINSRAILRLFLTCGNPLQRVVRTHRLIAAGGPGAWKRRLARCLRSAPVGMALLASRERRLVNISSFRIFNPNLCISPRTQFDENVTNMLRVVTEDAANTSIGVPPPYLPRHQNHSALARIE